MKYQIKVCSPLNGTFTVKTDNPKSCGDCSLALIFPNGRGLCTNSDFKSRVNEKPARLALIRGYTARCNNCLVTFPEYKKLPETEIWFKVWHTFDYSCQINELSVIESLYDKNLKVITLDDGDEILQFTANYTCFPSKDAAEVYVKMRIRNEIRRVKKYLAEVEEQHKIIKKGMVINSAKK